MRTNKGVRITLIAITDVLVLSILPADTVLQMVASVAVLVPISMGIQFLSTPHWYWDGLDVLLCVPYVLLLGLFLNWTSVINIIGNVFVLIVSAAGIYGYVTTRQRKNKS